MPDLSKILTHEERLLLALCRLDFTEKQKSDIRNLMPQVTDWDKFVNLSNEHGIIALCWYNIAEIGNKDNIPSNFLETLHSGYLKSLARNTKTYTLLEEVLNLSEDAGIKVVLLKGLALEKTIYGNKGLRQMNDLDILVRREDATKLRNILLKNDFESEPMISQLHEKILPTYGKHLPEMYRNGLSVEIHFNLFDKDGRKLTEKFIEQAKEKLNGREYAFLPSTPMHFLYLLKHLDFHERTGTSQLRLYTDLVLTYLYNSEIVKNGDLLNLAENAGIEKVLIDKLHILSSFFDLDYGAPATEKLIDTEQNKVEEEFIRYLRTQSKESEEDPESLLKPLSDLPGIYNKGLFII